jgi:hypothetical protein
VVICVYAWLRTDIDIDAPDASSYEPPDASSYAPDASSYAPDASSYASSYAPDASSYAPDASSYAPDARSVMSPEPSSTPLAKSSVTFPPRVTTNIQYNNINGLIYICVLKKKSNEKSALKIK